MRRRAWRVPASTSTSPMRYALNAWAGWLGRRWRSCEICSIQGCTVHHLRTWLYGDRVADHRLDREDWIAAGLDALESGGVEAVAVVPLARALGVTRGSFYWHFGSRDELLEAVLARWEDEHSAQTLRAVSKIADPRERLREILGRAVLKPPTYFARAARRVGPRAARRGHARALGEGPARHARQGLSRAAASPPPTPAAARCSPTPRTSGSRGCRWPARARSAPASAARSPTTWSRRSCPDAGRPSTTLRAPCRRRPPNRPSPSACSRATAVRSRGRSRSWSPTTRAAGTSCARSTRTPATPRSSASPALRAPASRR